MKLEDSLGDKLKEFEFREAGRTCLPGLPIIARLDGRAFHTFTKGLQRPYDQRLSDAMVATTCALIEETHASLGYTQSDEITLLWQNKYSETSEMLFSGRYQKLTSILASLASVEFFKQVIANIPEKKDRTPVFDCRVFQLPTEKLAADCFKWRELDATKNAISMAAHAYFSHKRLQGMNGSEKQELLFSEKGINFNDYPEFFKRGTYVRKVVKAIELSEEVLAKIPEQHRPYPGHQVLRSVVEPVIFGEKCTKILNFTDVVFNRSGPVFGEIK